MRLEIVVGTQSANTQGPLPKAATPKGAAFDIDSLARMRERARVRSTQDTLDVFIDGANVTARVRESQGALVLRDLALALVSLSHRQRAKATVRFYDEPWEMCVERFDHAACVSVYRVGPDPLIAVYDRTIRFDEIVTAALEAIDRVLVNRTARPATRLELASAADQLRGLGPWAGCDDAKVPEPVPVEVEPDRESPISFGATFAIREGPPPARIGSAQGNPRSSFLEGVERADIHALLFRGRVRAEVRGRSIDLGECHPVLVAERLAEMARGAFDAWERGLALHARGEAAGLLVGLRLSAKGDLALTLGAVQGGARRAIHTFPALRATDVLEAALVFGRALVRAILRHDRSQARNLRLVSFRRALRESTELLRASSRADSKINQAPEPYRAFAATLVEARQATGVEIVATRMRYVSRWRSVVPGIDLRATYLCGDRLVVGAAAEMWALDRHDGRILWHADVSPGTSILTPGGVARFAHDGTLVVYDLLTGEPSMRTRIARRTGGPMGGTVVHLPGLPKLVIVTEGEQHLLAVDLSTGEHRWRWSWATTRGSTRRVPRIKRAGKLLYVTCGDGALTALDVMTGAVVWRLHDRLRFRLPPTVGPDAVHVVAGGAHGAARLYAVDPYTGGVRWQRTLSQPSSPCTVEGAPLVASGAVGLTVRQRTGLTLVTFSRHDGRLLGETPERGQGDGLPSPRRSMAPPGTSWLALDDAFIGNAPTGELVAIDAQSGALRWRHVLGPRPLEADVPRRLEPVLRCGALFVPCSLISTASPARLTGGEGAASSRDREAFAPSASAGVCVVRPSDGAILATVAPTEAIPDLLRVDEECAIYIAEESGHLAAFGALPKLSLVQGQ